MTAASDRVCPTYAEHFGPEMLHRLAPLIDGDDDAHKFWKQFDERGWAGLLSMGIRNGPDRNHDAFRGSL